MSENGHSTHPQDETTRGVVKEPARVNLGADETASSVKFFGVIVMAGLSLLVLAYLAFPIIQQKTISSAGYIALAVDLLGALVSAISIAIAFRQRQELALRVQFYFILSLLLAVTTLFQGRTLTASIAVMMIAFIMIRWLLPQSLWRRYAAFSAGAFILTWVIEWINPSWRMQVEAKGVAIIAVIAFAIVLAIVIAAQVWRRSMRNKLVVAFIGVTVVATGALAVYMYASTTNLLRENLERELTSAAEDHATRVGDLFNEQLNIMTSISLNEVLQGAVEVENQRYPEDPAEIQARLDANDAQWQAAVAADNNADPLVQEHLTSAVALELLEIQQEFPENAEIFITDKYGGLAGTTNRTSDYNQADEDWWQITYNNGKGAVYISEPIYDESVGTLGVQIARPLRNRDTGEIIGILRTTYFLSALGEILSDKIGETGEADLVIPGKVNSHLHGGGFEEIAQDTFDRLAGLAGQGMVEMEYEGTQSVVTQAPMKTLEGNPDVDKLGWVVVFHQNYDEAFAPLNVAVQRVLFLSLIVVTLAVVAAFGFSLLLVRPITKLTHTAEEIASGNIETQAEVTSTDEVGTLATAFNTMTAQLREFIATLEERVAERTKDQATVADIATKTATIQDLQEMLATMVHLTQRGFGLYHAHVFLYRENTEELQIVACGYKEGDEHEGTHGTSIIPLAQEQSLVARAGRTRQPVIVNDVRSDPGWLPNPLLPDTHAEMAVPMIVGDKLLGVLDVQADHVDAFDDADATIQMTLAAQVAVAVQNILQFQTSQKMASDLGVVTEVGIAATTISDANRLLQEVVDLVKRSFELYHTHIYLIDETGDTLQLAAGADEVGRQMAAEGRSIELDSEKSLVARAARTKQGVVANDVTEDPDFLSNPLLPDTRAEMAVPMIVANKAIGVLDVQSETIGRFTDVDVNIQTTLASQIAIALQNARSFQEAQRQAQHETTLNTIVQKFQAADTIEDAMKIAARELGLALGKRQTLVALDPSALVVNVKAAANE